MQTIKSEIQAINRHAEAIKREREELIAELQAMPNYIEEEELCITHQICR